MSRKNTILFLKYILIYCLVLFIGVYFRLYPLRSFATSDASEKATLLVLAKLKKAAALEIDKLYHNTQQKEKEILTNKHFNELLHKNREQIRSSIDKAAKEIDYTSGRIKAYPYLLASDSYYFYNLTDNLRKNRRLGEEIKGSKYLNKMMLSPLGHWEPINIHPYVGYFVYKIIKFFLPGIELMYAVSFTPLFVTALTLIPLLLIFYLFEFNLLVSFTASIFFLLAPIYVKRSTFAWYDNDPENVFIIVTILAYLFAFIKKNHTLKQSLINGIIISALFLLYTLIWQGWGFIFAVLFASAIVILPIYYLYADANSEFKNVTAFFTVSFISSFIIISIAFGFSEFFILIKEGWTALKNFLTPQLSSWPDLYISVGELKKVDFSYIIKMAGGWFLFTLSCLGIAYFIIGFIAALKQKSVNSFLPKLSVFIVLLVFLVSSIYITAGALRFGILSFIPLCLFFAFGLQFIYELFLNLHLKIFKNNSKSLNIAKFTGCSLIVATTIIPIYNINTSIKSLLNPIYNQTWDNALKEIKVRTPKNSIINAWWPPGHFIKAIAQRRVTFDGATINVPQAYWLANVFLTSSETEAVGILRMLNNSANQAAEYLLSLGFDLPVSVRLIEELVKLDEIRAQILLSKIIVEPDKIKLLTNLLYKTPPPSYCLIYNEFVENNLQLSFIGKWNFKKIADINKDRVLIKEIPKRNSKEYIDYLWNLVGGAYKYSQPLGQISINGDIVIFAEDVRINIKSYQCLINSTKFGRGIPFSIFYLENDNVVEKKLNGSNLPFSVILTNDNNKYSCVLLDRPLAQSILMRLYFFDGKGLRYYKPFIKEVDLTKRTEITVFAIDWKRFEEDIKKGLKF